MKHWLKIVETGATLPDKTMKEIADWLLDESAPLLEKAEFLIKFHDRGESPDEIAALANAFLDRAVDPGLTEEHTGPISMDVCGTGGDKLGLFNISTCSMFLLAAGGVTVLKHGNRGITSRSGGADVLEALGVQIDLPPEKLRDMVARHRIGFLFAPFYHPAFRVIAPVRKALAEQGRRTVFNILGPLLNPARPTHQLSGVFDPKLTASYAEILRRLGRKRVWAVHGSTADGRSMDEVSTLGPTLVADAREGESLVSELTLTLPLNRLGSPTLADLVGGSAEDNARVVEQILTGSLRGPKRDIVELNAAAAFMVTDVVKNITEGMALASEQINNGKAYEKLNQMRIK